MALVTLNQFGVTIFRPQAGQQITMRPMEWLQLGALAEGYLGEIMRGNDNSKPQDVERTWILGTYDTASKMELRVTTSIFQDRRYVNIRVFVMDQPTKQGVALGLPEWSMVTSHLIKNEELSLAKGVYEEMLTEGAAKKRRSACYGCEIEAPSQRDHLCLTEQGFYQDLICSAAEEVRGPAFTLRIATSAYKMAIQLHYPPAELFDLVETYYGAEIREEAVKKRIPEADEGMEESEEEEEDQ